MLVLLMTACASSPPAPVVEKSTAQRQEIPVDGLYRIRSGDSLHAIAFKYGLDYRDIAQWNDIRSPWVIYPDQVLRLRPPPGSTRQVSRPVADDPPKSSAKRPPATQPLPKPTPVTPSVISSRWVWPTEGRVKNSFKSGDPVRKGLVIAGREGQDIMASAAGQVVYSGNGLIGYGELIIVKHSEEMLSAYAHNRRRLVKEGEQVRQGQKIAELGRNGRNEPVLHFEIRRKGQPVDPLKYLPKR